MRALACVPRIPHYPPSRSLPRPPSQAHAPITAARPRAHARSQHACHHAPKSGGAQRGPAGGAARRRGQGRRRRCRRPRAGGGLTLAGGGAAAAAEGIRWASGALSDERAKAAVAWAARALAWQQLSAVLSVFTGAWVMYPLDGAGQSQVPAIGSCPLAAALRGSLAACPLWLGTVCRLRPARTLGRVQGPEKWAVSTPGASLGLGLHHHQRWRPCQKNSHRTCLQHMQAAPTRPHTVLRPEFCTGPLTRVARKQFYPRASTRSTL